MIKLILRYYNHIISILLAIGIFLVGVVRDYLEDDLYISLVENYFWYSFGLFSGVFLTGYMNKKFRDINRNI